MNGFRMKIREQALGLALLTFMAACGGGGSSNSSGNVTPTLAPTPTPTATSIPTPIPTLAPGAVPKVFWVSQPVNPDETMLITGGNLDAQTQVELASLPDDDPGNPAIVAPNIATWSSRPALTATTRSITAAVPASWSGGVYALRLKNGADIGNLRLVNAPDPWFVQGDQGDTATPGGTFTVAGACLERSGGLAPQAVLVQKGTSTVVAKLAVKSQITTSTGYGLEFAVPAGTPEGDYELWLHNGRGGSAAWVKFSTFIGAPLETVTVKKVVAWPATSVNVSQQAGANDDERFANTIAAVPATGGRIVVPAGTYTLTKPLVLPPYTVLVGASRSTTLIKWEVDPSVANSAVKSLVSGKSLTVGGSVRGTFALEDLSLEISATTFVGNVVDRSFTKEPGWIKRVGITAPSTSETVWAKVPTGIFLRQTANTQLEDVLVDSAKGIFGQDGVSYLRLTDSVIRYNNLNIWFSSQSHNFLVSGNSFEKRGPLLVQASFGFSAFFGSKGPYTRDLLWTGNTITQIASDPTARTSGYTMDGGDGIYLGPVTGASGTTLNLAGPTATTDVAGKAVTYTYAGGIAQILDGKGAGQWRYLTEATQGATSVKVDRPWDIEPDASSTVSLVNLQGRVLMIDNDYVRDTQHDDYYLALDSIKAGNRFGVDGATTIAQCWTGKHYQGTFPGWHLQFLGNQVKRGASTSFNAIVYNDPASSYGGIVGSGQVYRNNTNATNGVFNLRLSSDRGGFADVLLEHNQATQIILRRVDPKDGHTEATAYSGVLLRGNQQASGAASTVQSLGSIPTGVVVIP